jgi:hypothetical protein
VPLSNEAKIHASRSITSLLAVAAAPHVNVTVEPPAFVVNCAGAAGGSHPVDPPSCSRPSFEGPLSPLAPTACTRTKHVPDAAAAESVVRAPTLPSNTSLAAGAVGVPARMVVRVMCRRSLCGRGQWKPPSTPVDTLIAGT